VGQIEAQHHVARIEHGQSRRPRWPGLRMGLDVDMFAPEKLLGPRASQLLDHVNIFAPAIIAASRVAFGIFIGQHAAHALHHGGAGVVFAGDHLQPGTLALDFVGDGCPNVGSFFSIEFMRPFQVQWVGRHSILDSRREFVNCRNQEPPEVGRRWQSLPFAAWRLGVFARKP